MRRARGYCAVEMSRSGARIWCIAMLAAACVGCAGGPQLPGLPVAMPSLDQSSLIVGSLQSEPAVHKAPSAEIYSRIARGANACWFGARGRHAKTHILHADVTPSMNGGGVEIIVHERAVDQPKPWGYKAFRIVLTESAGIDGTPGGGGTSIAVENGRFELAEAARMRSEAHAWAAGTEGCKDDPAADKHQPAAAAVVSPPKQPARKVAPRSAASTGASAAAK